MRRSKDKKRIDWLGDSNNLPFEFTPQMTGGVYVFGEYATSPRGNYFKSLRLAIDSAMKSERKGDLEK